MNNLKRVLSLVLALVMIVGVMAVASATEFTDQKEITHTEAVDTMNALGVILGKDDGSFDPTANITRGEMCTIIARILNSGKLPAVGSSTAYHFTDIAEHWARNYIEYCANLGIVNGRGDGTFDPNANVTAAEAAKMLLVAAGYKADVFELTGRDWELNTNSYANRLGIYDKLGSIDTSLAVNRDNAAQMAFNTLNVRTLDIQYTQDRATGDVTESYVPGVIVLAKYFGATTEYTYLTNTSYDATKKVYTYTFATNTFGATKTPAYTPVNLTSDKDFSDLFGQQVAIIYKVNNDGTRTLFGMSGVGTTLFEGVWADVTVEDDGSLTYAKTNYEFDDTTRDYAAFNSVTDKAVTDVKDYFTFKAIDNDDDGKIDVVVYNPVVVGKVAYVGSSNFYLSGGTTVKNADVTVYDGMAKGDFVTVTTDLSGKAVYTKIEDADIISGTVAASQGTKAQIDGTYYDVSTAIANDSALVFDADQQVLTATNLITKVNAKDKIKVVLVNGQVALVENVTTSAANTVFGLVLKTATGTSALDEKAQARILKTDGTTEDITITSAQATTFANVAAADNELVTIAGPSSGVYTLADAKTATTFVGVSKNSSTDSTTTAGKIGIYTIADDAVVFVKSADATPKYSVITGAALKKYTKTSFTVVASFAKQNSTTKFDQVTLAYVELNSAATLSTNTYGVVTGTVTNKPSSTYEADVYTTDGAKTALTMTSAYAVARDTVVLLTDNGDDTWTSVEQIATPVAISKYDASAKQIQFTNSNGTLDATVYNITSNTKFLYLDTANRVVAEGTIQLATKRNIEVSTGTYAERTVLNALVITNGSDVVLLVVDTANALSEAIATKNGATHYYTDA